MENLTPPFRRLKGYAFDPLLSTQMETAGINEIIYQVDWEDVGKGPDGEYLEVVDFDPSTGEIYKPVDLDSKYILGNDGLEPSESNPQFHQQMVYSVAMITIKNFEKGLGRKVLWSQRVTIKDEGQYETKYIQKLRIYPHALREANAFYSPQKKSILFGYFRAAPNDVTLYFPGGLVFTCLSQDIISHEVTHALLDGLHTNYNNPSNPDVLAFHEAFADIVALFQHFTFPEVLKHQIAKTRGNLESQNLLGQLAQEFGKAIGQYGSLRDAIGEIDRDTKAWKLKKPDPTEYMNLMEPHDRGGLLVATIFDSFLSIYKERIKDLIRIATGGSGILPEGELHPDLVNRLACEASKTASHILTMCIRALDYSPATDITFGDYLRALITADADLVKDDTRNYRLAFIDAFRKRGIYPRGISSLSVESLIYRPEDLNSAQTYGFEILSEFFKDFANKIYYVTNREKIYEITKIFIGGGEIDNEFVKGLHARIDYKFDGSRDFEKLTGLVFSVGWENFGIRTSKRTEGPRFQVQALCYINRVGPGGKILNNIILTLNQKCYVRCTKNKKTGLYTIVPVNAGIDENKTKDVFSITGSCTLIFDLNTEKIKYVIKKPLLDLVAYNSNGIRRLDEDRIIEQFKYMFEENSENDYKLYFGGTSNEIKTEPFSFLHRLI